MARTEMTISLWSQRECTKPAGTDNTSSEPKTIDIESGVNRATVATPAIGSPAFPTFDLASLPPIQSIAADTDIRSVLVSSVPVELTRVALRRAWATDPAIRDFVGIAEGQWDFNDPVAIPGFGPLSDAFDAEANSATRQADEIDVARAREYSLLAVLLGRSPDAQMIEHLAHLGGDTTQLGTAHAALGATAAGLNAEQIEREYFDLFLGLGRAKLFPYASYYLSGYFYGRPLARLRETLRQISVERTEGQSEPEDHAALLFEVMAGLAGGRIIAPDGTDRSFFEKHLKPWIGRFFSDLEQAGSSAPFYVHVGTVGRIFIDIETEGFSLST